MLYGDEEEKQRTITNILWMIAGELNYTEFIQE